MNTRLGALVCVVAGHRWAPEGDAHAGSVLLRCDRCRTTSFRSTETFGAEGWVERTARGRLAGSLHVRPEDADSRIRERRR
jgi:hypothetical protein